MSGTEAVMAAVTLAFLALVFVPLERTWSARRQRVLRPAFGTDLLFFAGQAILWNGLAFGALGLLDRSVRDVLPADLRLAVADLPLWGQVALVVLLGDLTIYWGHRLSHRIPLLWRFHKVHHTAEHLDWMAAYREHPLDGLFTVTLENLPAMALGFPLEVIAGFVAFRGLWAVLIHANVRLPLGPLKVVLGSPELHHWHHDLARGGRCNFANLSPLMDVVFGTYYAPPDASPARFGVTEPGPRSYLGQLGAPLLPRRLARRLGFDAALAPPSTADAPLPYPARVPPITRSEP